MLTMDTSNSELDYVLSGKTVDASVFSPDQWMRIVNGIYNVLYPYREYLTLIREHKKAVYDVCKHCQSPSVAMSVYPHRITYNVFTPAPSLDERTRLLPLIPLFSWEYGKEQRWQIEESFYGDKHILYDQYLLRGLTWVKLERRLQRVLYGGQPTEQVMVEYNFSELDETALINAVGERPMHWQMFCDSLLRHLQRVMDQKRMHLNELEEAYRGANEIRSRFAIL